MSSSHQILRNELPFHTAADALVVAKSVSNQRRPGSVAMVFTDDDRRLLDLFYIEGGADHLPELVEFCCSPDEAEVTGLFLVTDRTGEVPADRPDDELTWMELVASAREGGVTLFDWFVVWGTTAFSVAEHAPIGPQW